MEAADAAEHGRRHPDLRRAAGPVAVGAHYGGGRVRDDAGAADERARAVRVGAGDVVVVTDVEGSQVGDLWAIDAADHGRAGLPGHPNCADNFAAAARDVGVALPTPPDPVNLFQSSAPGPGGELPVRPAASPAGDGVSLVALRDVLTACSVDFAPTNGGRCTSLRLDRRRG